MASWVGGSWEIRNVEDFLVTYYDVVIKPGQSFKYQPTNRSGDYGSFVYVGIDQPDYFAED